MNELLSNGMAAQTLSSLLPDKTLEQWLLWLQNNRNPARQVAYRIPFTRLGGGIFYASEDVNAFVELEKGRALGSIKLTARAAQALRAFGISDASGSSTGRKLNVNSVAGQVDGTTGAAFIQLVTSDPLMVYRLEPEQARSLVNELSGAIQSCERLKSPARHTASQQRRNPAEAKK